MAKPYPQELRDRVLAAYDRGMKTRQIAELSCESAPPGRGGSSSGDARPARPRPGPWAERRWSRSTWSVCGTGGAAAGRHHRRTAPASGGRLLRVGGGHGAAAAGALF